MALEGDTLKLDHVLADWGAFANEWREVYFDHA